MNRNQRDRFVLDRLGALFDVLGLFPRVFTLTLFVGPAKNRDGSISQPQEIGKMRQQQTVTLSIDPTSIIDDRKYPAHLDGVPVWTIDGGDDLAAIHPSEDGLSATLESFDAEGSGVVTVTADGRAGPDVVNVVGTYGFAVTSGDAVSFTLTAGEAQDKADVGVPDEEPPVEEPPVETPPETPPTV